MSVESIVVFKGEMQLLSWQETSAGGAKVVFALADPDDLECFKSLTLAKGKQVGQRLAAVLVQIGDDEKPVEQHKGGQLAKLAGMFCANHEFQKWLQDNKPALWAQSIALSQSEDAAVISAELVRYTCGVKTRAELDHNKAAASIFHTVFRIPFANHTGGI